VDEEAVVDLAGESVHAQARESGHPPTRPSSPPRSGRARRSPARPPPVHSGALSLFARRNWMSGSSAGDCCGSSRRLESLSDICVTSIALGGRTAPESAGCRVVRQVRCHFRCHPPLFPDPRNRPYREMQGLSYWARQDSNLGPTDYESAALTAELRARPIRLPRFRSSDAMFVTLRLIVCCG
jgi:hypothetical protein